MIDRALTPTLNIRTYFEISVVMKSMNFKCTNFNIFILFRTLSSGPLTHLNPFVERVQKTAHKIGPPFRERSTKSLK